MEKELMVMIVEDRKDQAYILAQILVANDFRVVCARNGHEALTLIKEGMIPAVLVTDIKMPVLNGFELIEELKRLEIRIPTIITSGCGQNSHFEAAYIRGVENYLVKPFLPSRLIFRVNKAVGRLAQEPSDSI